MLVKNNDKGIIGGHGFVITPGSTADIKPEHWEAAKKNKAIQAKLKDGLLVEVGEAAAPAKEEPPKEDPKGKEASKPTTGKPGKE
jgi:hypothetical protein